MAFNGSLIKINSDEFPLHCIIWESYEVTPNRRQDLDSTRNANGYLMRNVLDHTATTIQMDTKPLTNDKLAEMMRFITTRYTDAREKKVQLTYYCPDIDDYKTGLFYIPDVQYPIKKIDVDTKTIWYKSFTIKFIEY